MHFLIRLQPFASLHKEMQNGRFDVADRLFSSIPMTFLHNTTQLSEVKELTPGNQVVNTKEDVYMTKLRCCLIYKKKHNS